MVWHTQLPGVTALRFLTGLTAGAASGIKATAPGQWLNAPFAKLQLAFDEVNPQQITGALNQAE